MCFVSQLLPIVALLSEHNFDYTSGRQKIWNLLSCVILFTASEGRADLGLDEKDTKY